jgi:hypothetical protein
MVGVGLLDAPGVEVESPRATGVVVARDFAVREGVGTGWRVARGVLSGVGIAGAVGVEVEAVETTGVGVVREEVAVGEDALLEQATSSPHIRARSMRRARMVHLL